MVALLAGKGLALAAGKPLIAVNHLEGHALSPRLVDPELDFPYLLLLVSGGHCQLLEVRGRRRLPPARDHHRRCGRRGVRQGRQAARPAYPGGPAIEAVGADAATRRAVPLPRPLVGSGEPHFSFAGLKSAVQRAVASGEYPARRHRRELPAGRRRLPRRPHPRSRCSEAMRRRWSSPAESRPIRRSARALAELATRQGPPVQRPARLALHRQCRDDRLGRRRALRRRADRRARRAGAGALAARRTRREGARRGGEGMKLGIIGGGAWGTALAQVAAAGGRETLLWALRAGGRRGRQRAPREPALSRRAFRSNPAIRATARPGRSRRLRRVARRHARAAHARVLEHAPRLPTSPSSSAPRASRKAAASCFTTSRERYARGADRRALRPDLRPRSARRACRPR